MQKSFLLSLQPSPLKPLLLSILLSFTVFYCLLLSVLQHLFTVFFYHVIHNILLIFSLSIIFPFFPCPFLSPLLSHPLFTYFSFHSLFLLNRCCCYSPDGSLIAVGFGGAASKQGKQVRTCFLYVQSRTCGLIFISIPFMSFISSPSFP